MTTLHIEGSPEVLARITREFGSLAKITATPAKNSVIRRGWPPKGALTTAPSSGSTPPEGPIVIDLEGEIGAGKSMLIERLWQRLTDLGHKVVIVPEPVDLWEKVGILQEFYADKPLELRGPVTYIFQTFTFVTRVLETIKQFENNPDATVFLLERCVLTDRFVFMELQRQMVGERYMEMYDIWWDAWNKIMPFQPTNIVYLKPTIDKCMERVSTRDRDGEVSQSEKDDTGRGGVSAAYQARLREALESYLQGQHRTKFAGIPRRPFDLQKDVVVVDGPLADADLRVVESLDKVAEHVINRIFPE